MVIKDTKRVTSGIRISWEATTRKFHVETGDANERTFVHALSTLTSRIRTDLRLHALFRTERFNEVQEDRSTMETSDDQSVFATMAKFDPKTGDENEEARRM